MIHAYLIAALVGSLSATDPPHMALQQPNGKAVYDLNCKKCHGPRGVPAQAMQRMMKTLPVLDSAFMSGLSLATVEGAISKGKGQMKPIDKLTPEETSAVAKYVFELTHAKPLAPKAPK